MQGIAFRRCLSANVSMIVSMVVLALSINLANASEISMYDYDVKQWTAQDGLSSQSARSITQDRLGYIWVGSLFGLNRFDGNKFEIFNTQNNKSLVSNAINKVFIDSSGYLWVGTKSGLSGVDPATLDFAYYTILDEVTDIVENGAREVLVAAGGLFKIVDKRISKIKEIKGEVRKIEQTPQGTWIVTDSVLYLLDENGTISKEISLVISSADMHAEPENIGQSIIHDLHWNEASGLFLSTQMGIYKVSDNDDVQKETLPGGQEAPVLKMFRDSRDGLWLSTYGTLYYRNGEDKWQPVAADQLGHKPWFTDIFEDRDANIWLASKSDGLWRASVSNISRHVPDNLPSTKIGSVVNGPKGKLWLGTARGIGTLDKAGKFELVIPGDVLQRQNIFVMAFIEDKVLVGTERGLWEYRDEKLKVLKGADAIQWSKIRAIAKSSNKGLWIGTSQGLYEYRDNRFIPFHMNAKFDSQNITYILDKGKTSWVGTFRGVYSIDGNSLIRLGQGTALYRSSITSILDLGERGVLISTLDDGLFFKAGAGGWTHYDESNGLANGVIVALHYRQSENMIWVSTLKGVYRFSATQFDRASGNIQIQNILSPFDRQLGTSTGRCCNGIGHQKIAEYGDSLWFPSSKGVVEIPINIDPFGDVDNRLPPIIQSIVTGNRKIVIGEQNDFQLDLNERDLTVFYSTLNFKLPQSEIFRYKLEGYDNNWHDVDKRRQAVFTNLPSGTFNFTVQSRLSNQSWSDAKETTIAVKIPKQFSETMLYRILVGVLIMLVLYGVMLLIRNREKRKRETLKELVDQRTTELQSVNAQLNEANQQLKQLSHKDELSGLRNRHFVYEQLPKDIEHYQRNRESMIAQGKSFALILINLDGFKHVNDGHGPIAGDSVLTQFAVLLTRETRGSDYVVRWGGDEFLIVLRDSQANQIESFIYELNLAVANGEFYLPDGQSLSVTASIGYALYPLPLIGGQLINWEVSLSLADMALHQVKNAGRNGWATVEFDDQVDAFEFEDNDALEAFVEQLFATGAARFNVRLADTNFSS
jgi:diguanylate cyclase (GGDEF)-like protein